MSVSIVTGILQLLSGYVQVYVRYVIITGKDSFKQRVGMPSEPCAEEFFSCFSITIIVWESVGWGLNVSHVGFMLSLALSCDSLSRFDKFWCDFSRVSFPTFVKYLLNILISLLIIPSSSESSGQVFFFGYLVRVVSTCST